MTYSNRLLEKFESDVKKNTGKNLGAKRNKEATAELCRVIRTETIMENPLKKLLNKHNFRDLEDFVRTVRALEDDRVKRVLAKHKTKKGPKGT